MKERFADIELLRYRLDGFEALSLRRKLLIYCLAEAALWGRDITTDQNCALNLRIRRLLEAVYASPATDRTTADYRAFEEYLKRVWFANGIHHHYGCRKFAPGFGREWLESAAKAAGAEADTELLDAIFRPDILPKRVNQADGDDLLLTSACNYYCGVSQAEAEAFYAAKKAAAGECAPSFGLNSRLVREGGELREQVWREGGMYGDYIAHITHWLTRAIDYAEGEPQREVLRLLIDYYRTGDLATFDQYSIAWLRDTAGKVDFINGFIETYGDPIGIKASWEGLVEYEDEEATRRCRAISDNAQWFEDHSPVDPRFRKPKVKGVSARGICAAMLGGDEYPSTAIGINLPNADWIRAAHGSKSVTIGNLTRAYDEAAKASGMKEEFVLGDGPTLALIYKYGPLCDDLHTDLHECLGHGSGQLLPGTDPDALGAYGATIEEARADLFGLYYIADRKMVELGLLPDMEAHKAQYYTYMMNGLFTQLVRIEPGHNIEEAHMRNRAMIAAWCAANGGGAVGIVRKAGKAYVEVRDYGALRQLFGRLLAEVQRIKSEGDYQAARALVERYGVEPDRELHEEALRRYKTLGIAPYKGFINPRFSLVRDDNGDITDVAVDYTESYAGQMMRYSKDYSL